MISFLKKDEVGKPGSGGFMGKGDIIFLLVVIAIVGGFLFYSKQVRKVALAKHDTCAQAMAAGEYIKARSCLEEARDLHYSTDSLDSIVYAGLSKLEDVQAQEMELLQRIDSLLQVRDTVALIKNLPAPERIFHFLGEDQETRMRELRVLVQPSLLEP